MFKLNLVLITSVVILFPHSYCVTSIFYKEAFLQSGNFKSLICAVETICCLLVASCFQSKITVLYANIPIKHMKCSPKYIYHTLIKNYDKTGFTFDNFPLK